MKTKFFVAAALALTGVATTAHADVKWESDYAAASAKSKESGKPLLIDFYTEWCGWCKKMDKDTYTDKNVEALTEKYVMLKLDAERGGKDAAKQFEVKGFPTLVYVSSTGKTLANNPGYLDVPNMTKTLQEILEQDAKEKATAKPTK